MTNLFITTRYGLYRYSYQMQEPIRVLSNRDVADSRLFPSRGIFGITELPERDFFMIVSRVVRRFPWLGKHSHAKKFNIVDPVGGCDISCERVLRGIRDVHQISAAGDLVFLADANMDRVLCYNYRDGTRAGVIYANPERDGQNHLNTVLAHGETLYIGLNSCEEGSRILKLDLEEVLDDQPFSIRAYRSADHHINPGISDTHDLIPYRGTFLSTASDDGFVFDVRTQEPLFHVSDWPRGLAITEEGIWVGASEVAKRSDRHQPTDGHLYLFEHETFEQRAKIALPESGQVYDMIPVPDSRLCSDGSKNGVLSGKRKRRSIFL